MRTKFTCTLYVRSIDSKRTENVSMEKHNVTRKHQNHNTDII